MLKRIRTKSHEEWLALRHKYIGGSDAASVIGLNPFMSRYALWAEKTGRMPPFEGNLATDVGTYLEEFIAKRFEKETGKKVRRENASIVNDAYPFAIANVDRVIVGEDAGLEIKSTSSLALSKFKNGEYPARFYCQCVHYLAVTGKKRWYLAVLIGNTEFKVFTIERDEAEIAELMEAERAFWTDHVLADIPPEIDSQESTSKALVQVFPTADEDTEIDLSSLEDDIEDLFEIKKQIKTLDGLKTKIENKIKAEMKDSSRGTSAMAFFSWTNSERRSFDADKFKSSYPNINLDQFYKVSQSRTFRVKERN